MFPYALLWVPAGLCDSVSLLLPYGSLFVPFGSLWFLLSVMFLWFSMGRVGSASDRLWEWTTPVAPPQEFVTCQGQRGDKEAEAGPGDKEVRNSPIHVHLSAAGSGGYGVYCRAPQGPTEPIAYRQSRSLWGIAYRAKLWGLWDRAYRAEVALLDTVGAVGKTGKYRAECSIYVTQFYVGFSKSNTSWVFSWKRHQIQIVQ